MKIEQYLLHVESRRVRRATIVILLFDAVLIAMIAAGFWFTFTSFGQTTLAQGAVDFVAWMGGAR